MSRSTDPGHFFQTDASESTRIRKAAKEGNKNGDPLILQSKILSVVPDPFSSTCVYIAESAGCVRKVDVQSKNTKAIYRGPAAPVTSVAIGGERGATVFGGCWDKDIWSWDLETKSLSCRFKGHSDFVKAIVCVRIAGKPFLVSGGADAKIIIWDTSTGQRLHTLRDKAETMMAIQDLALDPEASTESEIVVVSSSSDPHIRIWRIGLSTASQILDSAMPAPTKGDKTQRDTILEHETSVYKLLFAGDYEDTDLWSASADGTAKCLSRAKGWAPEETYEHGDYVRAVAVATDWVITAGRDENVKIWDRTSGDLWHVFEGHYEEVTGLVMLEGETKVVSVSIDGTVRTWPLGRVELEKARAERADMEKGVVMEEITQPSENLLTKDEEAELAELMDSDHE